VNLLVKDGPAHDSGIQEGDLLLSINTKGEYQLEGNMKSLYAVDTCLSLHPGESHSMTRNFFLGLLAHNRSTP
jgi:C-terminal processing protease CtpA/Prc